MAKDYESIKVRKHQDTTWIFFNRPDKLNAMNHVMLNELSKALDDLEDDTKTRCVIVSGEKKAFSTGADLKELQKLAPKTAKKFSIKGQQVISKIEQLSKPVIAAVNGYALGGGLELALACDFRIATDKAELGFPEIKLGFIPGWGGTQRLTRLVGVTNAKRLIMLGNRITAEEALKMGLVDKTVPQGELEKETKKLAQTLCDYSPTALKHAKYSINSMTQIGLEAGLKREQDLFSLLFSVNDPKDMIEDFLVHKETKNRETKSE